MQVGVGQNTELKILTGDLVSDSLGRATVVFESPQCKIPADNTLTPLNSRVVRFGLADNNQGIDSAEYKKGIVTSWKIKGREAF